VLVLAVAVLVVEVWAKKSEEEKTDHRRSSAAQISVGRRTSRPFRLSTYRRTRSLAASLPDRPHHPSRWCPHVAFTHTANGQSIRIHVCVWGSLIARRISCECQPLVELSLVSGLSLTVMMAGRARQQLRQLPAPTPEWWLARYGVCDHGAGSV